MRLLGENDRLTPGSTVATIGMFDGVHLGHVTLVNFLKRQAAALEKQSLVITFLCHPRQVLHPDQPFPLIMPRQERLNRLQELEPDLLLPLDFTRELSQLNSNQFIELLRDRYGMAMLVVGCLGVRMFAKIVSVEKKMLYPIILVVSLLGAFSINKSVFDVGVCVLFGVIGWLMNKYEFPLSPILLALILGPMCEQNFVRFVDLNQGNFWAILQHPIAIGFFAVSVE